MSNKQKSETQPETVSKIKYLFWCLRVAVFYLAGAFFILMYRSPETGTYVLPSWCYLIIALSLLSYGSYHLLKLMQERRNSL